MSLPPPPARRALAHTRRSRFEGYKREDGLWDIEGHLTDIKPFDMKLGEHVRAAGNPVHDMWIRLTIDRQFTVVEAEVSTDAMPFPGLCERVAPDYRNIVGLKLTRGFRKAVLERFANIAGCTHLTELLVQFPTAALQTLSGERRSDVARGAKPFPLNRCHAWDERGEVVRRYHPRWFVRDASPADESSSA